MTLHSSVGASGKPLHSFWPSHVGQTCPHQTTEQGAGIEAQVRVRCSLPGHEKIDITEVWASVSFMRLNLEPPGLESDSPEMTPGRTPLWCPRGQWRGLETSLTSIWSPVQVPGTPHASVQESGSSAICIATVCVRLLGLTWLRGPY